MLNTLARPVDHGFSFATADRRAWRVTLTPDAVRYLTDETAPDDADIARALQVGAHHLELAALRRIARGRIDGDRIELDAADLGAR